MLNVIIVIVLCAITMACNNNQEFKVEPSIQDSIISSSEPVKDSVTGFKSLVINEDYFTQKTASVKPISDTTVQQLLLTDIEDINRNNSAVIKIADTLWSSDLEKFIIVTMEGDAESSAYIVHLKNNKLKQFEQVFYADVVEYFMSINTVITNQKVVITKTTDTDDKKSKEIKTFVLKEGSLQLEK